MFITGKCSKCKELVVFDIGDKTKEQVEKFLKERDFGHCAVGWHVEVGKMSDYYILDWSHFFNSKKEANSYNER